VVVFGYPLYVPEGIRLCKADSGVDLVDPDIDKAFGCALGCVSDGPPITITSGCSLLVVFEYPRSVPEGIRLCKPGSGVDLVDPDIDKAFGCALGCVSNGPPITITSGCSFFVVFECSRYLPEGIFFGEPGGGVDLVDPEPDEVLT
jgi:hypothetical protein